MDFISNNYLIADRCDGLCCRLINIFTQNIYAILLKDYCIKNNKKLWLNNDNKINILIHWILNDSVPLKFENFFIINKNNKDIDYYINYDNNLKFKTENNHYINFIECKYTEHLKIIGINHHKFIENIYDYIIENNIKIIKNKYNITSNNYIDFNNNIKSKGDKLLKNNKNLIGIHIRTKDIKKINLNKITEFINTYNLKNYTFVLSSMDEDDLKFFQNIFPTTTFIKQQILYDAIGTCDEIKELQEKHNNYNIKFKIGFMSKEDMFKSIEQDLIDYYLLSKCKFIIGTSRSSSLNRISSFSKSLVLFNNNIIFAINNNSDTLEFNKIISEEINKIIDEQN